MGKRREPRLKVELPVKVCGMDSSGHPFVQTAYTVTLSRRGVRLTGLGELVKIGDPVVVIYKGKRSRFRVTWIGQPGFAEQGQVGLTTVEPNVLLWDVPLPQEAPDTFQSKADAVPNTAKAPGMAAPRGNEERRRAQRFKCRGSAEIFTFGMSYPLRAQVDDVSLTGIYVHTFSPLPVGTGAKVVVAMQEFRFEAQAEVRTCHPGVGMGMMFKEMTSEHHAQLVSLINRFTARMPKPVAEKPAELPARMVGARVAAADRVAVGPTASVYGVAEETTRNRDSLAGVQSQLKAALPLTLLTDPVQCAAVGREIVEWFKTNDSLSRDEFVVLAKKAR